MADRATTNPDDGNPAPRKALAGPTLARIMGEVKAGLKNSAERREHATANLEFYNGDFERFQTRPPGTSFDQGRYPRSSLVMNRVVKTLCSNLYASGPKRSVPGHPDAEALLERVYRKHLVDAKWQHADRLTCVSDVVAWQVAGDVDPDCPVKFHLWDSSAFEAWCDPDDPCEPVAVATIDRYDCTRRIRLYTAEVVQTWVCDKFDQNQPLSANDFVMTDETANPYGVLPFSFAFFELPTSDFWSAGGPGGHLRELNDGVNLSLTNRGDSVRYNLLPVILLINILAGWRPPSPVQPGDMWDLPPAGGDVGRDGQTPDAKYLQADPSFVGASIDDLDQWLSHALEMNGVPPSAIRLEQTGAQSGRAIVAEQIPLIRWAEGRQRPFSHYEAKLARLVLLVAAAHLKANGRAGHEALAAAARESLVLRWADMYPDLPGPERDEDDQWLLDNGLTSRLRILMRREKASREEAQAALDEIAAELAREQKQYGGNADAALAAATSRPRERPLAEAGVEAETAEGRDNPTGPKPKRKDHDT